ncbi:hypothetical protein ACFW16_34390 [Inquilinus sp. NPDC058860]|uniref:hypothetical protein n=1 Tax=Inquilinus sp. NPDC058860 TaxID=3346652 RepID=UPI00368F7E78
MTIQRVAVSLDSEFLFCSNSGMVDGATRFRTLFAASSATDEADLAMLSRMAHLAEALAAGFQAQGVAALKAGDLDRAGTAETHFSNLFLGIRRAIALKARLRQQREDAQRRAAAQKDRRQDGKDRRRRAVGERVSRAIAAGKPEARERLTAELWERLTEDERIDVDLADTALPIEALIRRLGRAIGLSRQALAAALDLNGPKADPAGAGRKPWDEIPGHAAANPPPPPRRYDYTPGTYRTIPAADLGLPGDEIYNLNTTTGEIFAPGGRLFRKLDDRLPDPGGAGPSAAAGPPDSQPPPAELDPDEAEFQRQAAYAKQHGITLFRPPALARRLGLPEHGTADGSPTPGNRHGADKRP